MIRIPSNVKKMLIYCDYYEIKFAKVIYKDNFRIMKKFKKSLEKAKEKEAAIDTPVNSVALKYLNTNESGMKCDKIQASKAVNLSQSVIEQYNKMSSTNFRCNDENFVSTMKDKYEKYVKVSENASQDPNTDSMDEEKISEFENQYEDFSKVNSFWMTDYEIYDDEKTLDNITNSTYGTPNPNIDASTVPCGGCGAFLQCNDTELPGYLPSELFIDKTEAQLKSITCQRCHFMKNYNTCLNVKVSANDYPKFLEQLKNSKASVILLIDLTDFPCSIWPRILSLIGEDKSVYVVGNKIDLLPKDSKNFLEHVKYCLKESLIQNDMFQYNIKHISLVSAKTGYGIEDLISTLYKLWNYKNDVYLVGCANSGKSTLFNALLNSDFCKSQAVDLIQRATVTSWPGTTLNLLKFPILKPTGSRRFERWQKLVNQKKLDHIEELHKREEFNETGKIESTTVESIVSHTFKRKSEINDITNQMKSTNVLIPILEKPHQFGLDEEKEIFKHSRWCYDTPGAIHPDTILHLLTTNEIKKTLPDKIISPRTFCIRSNQTIFIAGLARLDVLHVPNYIRCTIFCSQYLPITICKVQNAEIVYNELIVTEVFKVPVNDPERLKDFPALKSKDLEIIGVGKSESASDIILSNVGWIAITGEVNETFSVRAWTPEGRGIHLRTPALLPKSVSLRGDRKFRTPAYELGKQVYVPKS